MRFSWAVTGSALLAAAHSPPEARAPLAMSIPAAVGTACTATVLALPDVHLGPTSTVFPSTSTAIRSVDCGACAAVTTSQFRVGVLPVVQFTATVTADAPATVTSFACAESGAPTPAVQPDGPLRFLVPVPVAGGPAGSFGKLRPLEARELEGFWIDAAPAGGDPSQGPADPQYGDYSPDSSTASGTMAPGPGPIAPGPNSPTGSAPVAPGPSSPAGAGPIPPGPSSSTGVGPIAPGPEMPTGSAPVAPGPNPPTGPEPIPPTAPSTPTPVEGTDAPRWTPPVPVPGPQNTTTALTGFTTLTNARPKPTKGHRTKSKSKHAPHATARPPSNSTLAFTSTSTSSQAIWSAPPATTRTISPLGAPHPPTCTRSLTLAPALPRSTLTVYPATVTHTSRWDCGGCAVVYSSLRITPTAPVAYVKTKTARRPSVVTELVCTDTPRAPRPTAGPVGMGWGAVFVERPAAGGEEEGGEEENDVVDLVDEAELGRLQALGFTFF
ncbi:hypothetical protein ESCO_003640 [Escovopsis weberi]|uniref:Uncharacterized protein n=1 Tax=Escovopsis weberi TaxID=150374 RepID=A0A0M9VX10_ESCWE|nr:hypothetical protein ESCO_003640 [Escovopsis weberi]